MSKSCSGRIQVFGCCVHFVDSASKPQRLCPLKQNWAWREVRANASAAISNQSPPRNRIIVVATGGGLIFKNELNVRFYVSPLQERK